MPDRYCVGTARAEPRAAGTAGGRCRRRCGGAARAVRHGFTLDPAAVAETPGGAVVTALRRWAVQYGKAVAGSVAIAEAGRFFNRMYFVTPDGGCVFYDKHHLFTPGGEARNYTPGRSRTVVEYRGFRFLLLVCYDLRFPVWSRCRRDYDAILCCASWPASRREVWRTLLRAGPSRTNAMSRG